MDKRCTSRSCTEAVSHCGKLKYCTHVVIYGDSKRGAKRPGGGVDSFARLMGSTDQTSQVAARVGATGGAATRGGRVIAQPMLVTPAPETWKPMKVHHSGGGKLQVFVFSHRRSGTHLSMSFLQHNFPQAKVVKVGDHTPCDVYLGCAGLDWYRKRGRVIYIYREVRARNVARAARGRSHRTPLLDPPPSRFGLARRHRLSWSRNVTSWPPPTNRCSNTCNSPTARPPARTATTTKACVAARRPARM